MVVVFLIITEDEYDKHKQTLKFWLGRRSYTENYLGLLFFFLVGQNHMIASLHQSIEASNNGFKIDNRLFLASLISFLNISLVYLSFHKFLWYYSGVCKFHNGNFKHEWYHDENHWRNNCKRRFR